MKFQTIIKTFVSKFTTIATASVLLVSAAQAECNFFTGWVDNKDGTVRDPRNGLVWNCKGQIQPVEAIRMEENSRFFIA